VAIHGFDSGAAPRSQPTGKQPTRRNLMLSFAGAVLGPLVAVCAKADALKDGAPSTSVNSGAAHAVLYNEDPSSQGQRYAGSVTWRIDRGNVAEPPEDIVVHADIEIPDRVMMTLDFKRNADQSLPASHVVKLTFAMPRDAVGDEVIAVPGLLMKFTEQGQGVPFASQTTKAAKGIFLIGLSNVKPDRERNLQLLKERQWISVLMVHDNQLRSILVIEKGLHGEAVLNEAMVAWSGLGEPQ
jgi:hypothetical protein